MNSFTIAIATNDDIHIADSHFGDAAFFLTYSISENSISQTSKKENTFQNADENHASSEKMKKVLSLLRNTDALISRKSSPNFLKIAEKSSVQPIIINYDSINEILLKIQSRFHEIAQAINEKQNNSIGEVIFIEY